MIHNQKSEVKKTATSVAASFGAISSEECLKSIPSFLPPTEHNVFQQQAYAMQADGLGRAHAFYFLLKRHYPNGVIYNYTAKSVSDRTKESIHIVKKYFDALLKEGFIKKVGRHHRLMPNREAQKLCTYKKISNIKISDDDTLKSIDLKLKAIAATMLLMRQQYVATLRKDRNKQAKSPVVDNKKLKKLNRKLKIVRHGGTYERLPIASARFLKRKVKLNHSDFKSFVKMTTEEMGWKWEKGERIYLKASQLEGLSRYYKKYAAFSLDTSSKLKLLFYNIPSRVSIEGGSLIAE